MPVAVEIATAEGEVVGVAEGNAVGRSRSHGAALLPLVRREVDGAVTDLVRQTRLASDHLALLRRHAGRERAPALQVVGEHDDVGPVAIAIQVAAVLSHAEGDDVPAHLEVDDVVDDVAIERDDFRGSIQVAVELEHAPPAGARSREHGDRAAPATG